MERDKVESRDDPHLDYAIGDQQRRRRRDIVLYLSAAFFVVSIASLVIVWLSEYRVRQVYLQVGEEIARVFQS